MEKSKKMIDMTKKNTDNVAPIIKALEEIKNNEFVSGSELFKDDFKRIIERLRDETFRLAVVGEFSSGKSTFLNALIGKDILKHGAKETTATVTEIQNDFSQDKSTLMDVYYADGQVKRNIHPDEITDYTSTSSKKYAVAQEIEKVVIRGKLLDSNAPVCFVDTPGLNGIADNHREKTVDEIKNAHACIYLMQVRGLGQSDIDFLKFISKYQHNIIFVQNFIDELKKLEGESPEEKIREQRRIIEEKVLGDGVDFRYQIIAISARKALLARAYEFESYDGEKLTEEIRERLYTESNYEKVLDVINGLMLDNEREKIQRRDAVSVALDLLNHLSEIITFKNVKEHEEWAHSVEGIKNKNYRELIDSLKNNKKTYQDKLDNYIESEVSDIRKENKKDISQGIEDIEAHFNKALRDIAEIDAFEGYIAKKLPNEIYSQISGIEDKANSQLHIRFENLISNAVLRVKQYIGGKTAEINMGTINVQGESSKNPYRNFEREEGEIIRLQRDISEKKRLEEKSKRDIQNIRREKESINSELAANDSRISQNHASRNSEIRRLGAMPEKEKKYRTETYYEYRGGTGFLDWVFGPKEKTRSVPYYDDTKQQNWLKQKSDIETRYRIKENQMNAQSRLLEQRRLQCDEELSHIARTEDGRKREIESMESLLKTKQEYIVVQKQKAKQEYLRELKNSTMESVKRYLYNIKNLLIDNFERVISGNQHEVEKIIHSLFDVSYNQRIQNLEDLVNNHGGSKGYEGTDNLLNVIKRSRKILEEYLCQQ